MLSDEEIRELLAQVNVRSWKGVSSRTWICQPSNVSIRR